MTPNELIREARERHRWSYRLEDGNTGPCVMCQQLWPCDATQIADALEAALGEKRAAIVIARKMLGYFKHGERSSLQAQLDALENPK